MSHAVVQRRSGDHGTIARISAPETENLVVTAVREYLKKVLVDPDRESYTVTPNMSDASEVPANEMRALFEQFVDERG